MLEEFAKLTILTRKIAEKCRRGNLKYGEIRIQMAYRYLRTLRDVRNGYILLTVVDLDPGWVLRVSRGSRTCTIAEYARGDR
jgi:hypothetical protein